MYGFNDLLPKNRDGKGKHCGTQEMKLTIISDVTWHQILLDNVWWEEHLYGIISKTLITLVW